MTNPIRQEIEDCPMCGDRVCSKHLGEAYQAYLLKRSHQRAIRFGGAKKDNEEQNRQSVLMAKLVREPTPSENHSDQLSGIQNRAKATKYAMRLTQEQRREVQKKFCE